MLVSYNIDYDAVNRHVRERMAQAAVKEKPVPHLQMDNLLPDDYYDLLLDALPLPQDLGSDNNGALNFGVTAQDPTFTHMTPQRQQLWLDFENRVNQPTIRKGMIDLFAGYLSLKFDMMLDGAWKQRAERFFGQDWQQLLGSAELYQPLGASGGRILLYTRDFHLRPHVDNATSLLTYLFYMPRDNKREQLGTKMHGVANPAKVCDKFRALKLINVWFPEPKELTRDVYPFPFRRNSLAAMMCLPTSVHSAQFQKLDYCRYVMQTQIFLRDDVSSALFEGWKQKAGSY